MIKKPLFSLIVPVYNRTEEINDLLESILNANSSQKIDFEIVIVEDGSVHTCENVIKKYAQKLRIKYLKKENTGPGDSRNYGMKKAIAEYFIFLDSDVELHPDYLTVVRDFLKGDSVDCFGGADGAKSNFTPLQKAVDYSMTSFFTTGGIRGKKSKNFQPRSFNMGLSKKAFLASGGFGKIHPGEDPDLVLRLWKMGFKTAFVPRAKVFHKRRISWKLFYRQMYKFGQTRAILNEWHPEYKRLIFWLPSAFFWGLFFTVVTVFFRWCLPLYFYGVYAIFILTDATIKTKNIKVGLMAVIAVFVQFTGYGSGFLNAFLKIKYRPKTDEKKIFPELFF